MAQFGWCSLKSSRRLSTHIHLQINKINSIFPNILPLFQSGCRSQQTISDLIYRVARSKRHPSDGSSHCNVLEAKTQYSSGTSLRCPLDIFAPALPPFPASRYAELVSGGHLPTIAVRGRTAPSLYVFLASLELSFWLATLPLGCIAGSRRVKHHYFATRKTPLNSSCILQCSTKGATSRCTKLLYTFNHRTI